MNKKIVILIVVLLLLLVAGGAYWFFSKKPNSNQTSTSFPQPTSEVSQLVPTAAAPKTLKELLTSGFAQKCTFSINTENYSGTGTMYINSGKVRGDIDAKIADKTTISHMLVDGNTTYVWMGEETTGFKMTLNPEDKATASAATKNNGSIDPNQALDYNCSPWVVDANMFKLPTTVKFSDFSSMIKPKAPGATSDKCAACSYLTGEEKTQCLSALNCN
jgi:hypothetical protein